MRVGDPLAIYTATVNHGLTTSETVTISGASDTFFNGSFVITVTGPTTFTYVIPAQNSAMADNGVTAVCSRLANHTVFGPVLHLSSSPVLKGDYYKTEMSFSLTVAIHSGAWANLLP
jgi:hypothetical protein